MKPKFKENKVTQAAAIFLKLSNQQMKYIKLIKLLYLAEREAFLRFGRPISFDSYVSMDRGPVLSNTYRLIVEEQETKGPWLNSISNQENFEVRLYNDPGSDKLSDAEEQIITEVFKEHGSKSPWDLCDYTHSFGEWQDPHGSSIPIDYREILRAGDKTEADIESIMEDIENIAMMEMYD